jgi:hypothetical protein
MSPPGPNCQFAAAQRCVSYRGIAEKICSF